MLSLDHGISTLKLFGNAQQRIAMENRAEESMVIFMMLFCFTQKVSPGHGTQSIRHMMKNI
jgi:hypothetical protein